MVDAFALGGPVSISRIRAEISSFRERHCGEFPDVIEMTPAEAATLIDEIEWWVYARPQRVTAICGIPIRIVEE